MRIEFSARYHTHTHTNVIIPILKKNTKKNNFATATLQFAADLPRDPVANSSKTELSQMMHQKNKHASGNESIWLPELQRHRGLSPGYKEVNTVGY